MFIQRLGQLLKFRGGHNNKSMIFRLAIFLGTLYSWELYPRMPLLLRALS
jgi:hypothetical protein